MVGTTTTDVETTGTLHLGLFEEGETTTGRAFAFRTLLGMQRPETAPTVELADGEVLETEVGMRRHRALLAVNRPRAMGRSLSMLMSGRRNKYALIGTGIWARRKEGL